VAEPRLTTELADILFRNADVRRERPKPKPPAELGDVGCEEYRGRRGREPPGSAADDQRSLSYPWSFASVDRDVLEPSRSIRGSMGALGSTVLERDAP
jgi:hypothetical protein